MSYDECDYCGLNISDLPIVVDSDLVFDHEGGMTWCIVHSDDEVEELFAAKRGSVR